MFKGKTVIVSGGASGMGACAVKRFAAAGARVFALDLAEGLETEQTAERTGMGVVEYRRCDIACPAEAESVVAEISEQVGAIHVLHNNAGLNLMKPIEETSDKEFSECFDVNVRGTFNLCRAVIPHMLAEGGSIINVSSSAAVVGRGFLPVYSAAKAAVLAFTKSLAVRYGPNGIRVNCIVPGSIETPMFLAALQEQSEAALRSVSEATPLRRVGTVDDIADAVLFLASDQSAYLTGVILPVDGGRTCTIQEPVGAFESAPAE